MGIGHEDAGNEILILRGHTHNSLTTAILRPVSIGRNTLDIALI